MENCGRFVIFSLDLSKIANARFLSSEPFLESPVSFSSPESIFKYKTKEYKRRSYLVHFFALRTPVWPKMRGTQASSLDLPLFLAQIQFSFLPWIPFLNTLGTLFMKKAMTKLRNER